MQQIINLFSNCQTLKCMLTPLYHSASLNISSFQDLFFNIPWAFGNAGTFSAAMAHITE